MFALLLAPLLLLTVSLVFGDSEKDDPLSVDDVAVQWLNPVGPLAGLSAEFSVTHYQGTLPGAGGQEPGHWMLTSSVPFNLSSGRRIVARLSVPVSMGTPTYREAGVDYTDWLIRQRAGQLTGESAFFEGHGHLEDVGFDVVIGDTRADGRFWMAGLAGTFPTSEDLSVAREQTLLGPVAGLGKITDWGIVGVRFSHLVDVAGDGNPYIPGSYDTAESRLKVLFAYGLGSGWQLVSQPEILYDWEAGSGNQWSLPLGGGLSKTLVLGRVPLRLDLEAYYYAASPDAFGPQWSAIFRVTPMLTRGFFSAD